MKILLKSASYIFHPLWMPFAGSVFYFGLTPRFFPTELVKAKLLAIAISTLFIPIVFYFLLKNLGKARSVFLTEAGERKWPLFFFSLLVIMVLHQILNAYNYPALYFYFLGILISTIISYFLLWFRIKASLHMTGLAGFLVFIAGLSVHYHISLVYSIAFIVAALGLTATSRLFYKAHSTLEILLGILIGFLPQLLLWYYWI